MLPLHAQELTVYPPSSRRDMTSVHTERSLSYASTPDPGTDPAGPQPAAIRKPRPRRPRRSTVVSRDFGASAEAGWPKTYQNDRYVA